MNSSPIILWFQRDLRLADNPALQAALADGGTVLPVFIMDEAAAGNWAIGGASRWWLHHSLASLADTLHRLGSRLLLARGGTPEILVRMAHAVGAKGVYWNQCLEPASSRVSGDAERELMAGGVRVKTFKTSALFFEPGTGVNKQGSPYQVFTPYWRHCLDNLDFGVAPLSAPRSLPPVPSLLPGSLALEELGLLPGRNWAANFSSVWTPGEVGATARLRRFLVAGIEHYDERRDIPSVDGTSGLSPHLHYGEITPRLILASMRKGSKDSGVFPGSRGEQRFLAELGWREFAHHLLYHFPDTPREPLRGKFAAFPWSRDPGGALLRAWQRGRTGYPIVDAGMRQLWTQGTMHNRVRMIAASFLVKHLRLPWQKGAEWFWDTLVDADLANNTLGWQWSAGCGADAAPYFRIFNPVLQGKKFDPEGIYVRRWVPELAKLPAKWIQNPWEAPPHILRDAGICLGETYPVPLVNHAQARKEALDAFASLKL